MKLLAIGRPRPGVNVGTAIPALARAELMVVLELYGAGVIREMYSRAEPGAVLVLETPTVGTATAALARLPLVVNDLVEFEFIELRPFGAFDVLFPDRSAQMPGNQSPRNVDNQERRASDE
jgi:hypothetical protein